MLIKKIVSVILFSLIFSFTVLSASFPEISGEGAVLLNADTKEVIFEKNKDKKLSMASTTKIMTSLLAIESGRLQCVVTAKKDVSCEGTAIGIKKGDSFTLETLVYAMLLESGNDAAILTAEYLAGSEADFSALMNEKAKEIGMTSTNFVTASGLDSEEHYTTAYDMALLGAYAIKNPAFRKICSAKNYSADYISPDISATYSNHNKLLDSYEGVFGIKTGFTKKSGRCLVSCCEKNDITLVAVTLNAGDDWNDHIKMYDYGYSVARSEKLNISIPDKIRVYGSEKSYIKTKLTDTLVIADEKDNFSYEISLKKWVYAPVSTGDVIGYIYVKKNGHLIKQSEIAASENADILDSEAEPQFSFLYKLKQLFSNRLNKN